MFYCSEIAMYLCIILHWDVGIGVVKYPSVKLSGAIDIAKSAIRKPTVELVFKMLKLNEKSIQFRTLN